jgi:thermitase
MKDRSIKIIALLIFLLLFSSSIAVATKIDSSKVIQKNNPAPHFASLLNGLFYINGTSTTPTFIPRELLIKFKDISIIHLSGTNEIPSTGITSIDTLIDEDHALSLRPVFTQVASPSLSAWYLIQFGNNSDARTYLNDFKKNPHIEIVEPNYCYSISSQKEAISKLPLKTSDVIPNDPLYSQQWGLKKIDASAAWNYQKGDANVTIAIIDTGVDYTHLDLSANIWSDNYGNHGYDFVNNDNDPMDDNGHGTECAGIAAAVTNNSIGIAGVCWNCKIMAMKGFNESGAGLFNWVAESIVYATDHGANIISMSWTGPYDSNLLKDALNYAYTHSVVLVAAAGNSGDNKMSFPAAYENVIAVAASDQNDEKAGFSTYGQWIDVAAPGVSIYTTIPGDDYCQDDGTSMACPFAVGVAALILSQHLHCPCPAQMVRSMLPYTSDPTHSPFYIGAGRVNASQAVQWEPYAAIIDPIYHWEDAKDIVDISGAAWAEHIKYFTLDYGIGSNPSSWIQLKNSSTSCYGILDSLDTKVMDEGLYTLRLMLVTDSHSYSMKAPLYVNNKADGEYEADLYVSDCYNSTTPGWGTTHFAGIQNAIDHSTRGNTIFVYDGIYPEDISIQGPLRAITLIGQHKNWTFIDGSVLLNKTRKVTVDGFSIRGVTINLWLNWYSDWSFKMIDSPYCTCSNNIFPYPGSSGPVIWVYTNSHHSNVIGNVIQWKRMYNWVTSAIFASLTWGVNISSNTVIDAPICLGYYQSFSGIIYNNIQHGNGSKVGILLSECWKVLVLKNNATSVFCDYYAMGCTIVGNELIGISFQSSGGYFNHIYHNNIGMGYDDGNFNFYYKHKGLLHGIGNYWGDYNGTDANGDGIGDTPYIVKGSFCRDRFPFIKPIDLKNLTGVGDIFKGYLDSPFFLPLSRIHSFDILLKTL